MQDKLLKQWNIMHACLYKCVAGDAHHVQGLRAPSTTTKIDLQVYVGG